MPVQSEQPTLLKVEEVAALLNVSRWFVYDHGDDLGLVKIGGSNRYLLERVEEYITNRVGQRAATSAGAPVGAPKRALPSRPSRSRSRRVPLLD